MTPPKKHDVTDAPQTPAPRSTREALQNKRRDAEAALREADTELAALDAASAADYESAVMQAIASDEGIIVGPMPNGVFVNLTDPEKNIFDTHRQEIHVGGVCYQHVTDSPTGQWIYRHDT